MAIRTAIAWGLVFSVAGPALAQQRDWDALEDARYQACLNLTATDPDNAYEDGLAWRYEGGGVLARHCIAAALVAMGRYSQGAERLEAAAGAPDAGAAARSEMRLQATYAWLEAGQLDRAEGAASDGLRTDNDDPDLLIARAVARGRQANYAGARSDLSLALSQHPDNAQALTLRAESHLQLGDYDAAQRDIDDALAIDPNDVETLLVRGRLRETVRTGAAPDRVR